MILDILLLVASTLFAIIGSVTSLIPIGVPSQFREGLEYFLPQFMALQGIFPVDELLLAVALLLSAFVGIYSVKIALKALGFIPGVKSSGLPGSQRVHD